jgi:hypothetical protein
VRCDRFDAATSHLLILAANFVAESRISVEDYLQKSWRWLGLVALALILLGAGIFIFATLPPRTVVMSTGAEGVPTTSSASVTVKSWRNPASHYSCCQHRAVWKIWRGCAILGRG